MIAPRSKPTRRPSTTLDIGSGATLFLLIGMLLLAAAFYSQANVLFWAFGMMVAALVISIFVPSSIVRRIYISRLTPASGEVGQPLRLRYQLTNRARWLPAFGLIVHERTARRRRRRKRAPQKDGVDDDIFRAEPHGWVLHLGPRQTVLADAPCWPARRGELRLARLVVACGFPFGIVTARRNFDRPERLLIYPSTRMLARRTMHRLLQADFADGKRTTHVDDGDEFFGLREYRPGDSQRIIDWKHTARTGVLISREMRRLARPTIIVCLDLRDPRTCEDREAVEHAIALTASLLTTAHRQGSRIGMVVYGVECPSFAAHHSGPMRHAMLAALARLDLDKRLDAREQPNIRPSVVIRPGDHGQAHVERAAGARSQGAVR